MRLFLVIALISILFNANSQVVQDWAYHGSESYKPGGFSNIIRNGNNTYVCSQSDDSLETAYIFRLDANGVLINQDSIQDFNYWSLFSKRMVMDTSGSIYLCGETRNSNNDTKLRIIKYDSLLSRVWDQTYSNADPNFYQVCGLLYSVAEHKIYLVGSQSNSGGEIHLVKYDTDGNYLWTWKDTVNGFGVAAFETDHLGNIILAGTIHTFNGLVDFSVLKINSAGSLEWSYIEDGSSHFPDYAKSISINDWNEIYVRGYFIDTVPDKLLKIDPNGNRIWSSPLHNLTEEKIASDHAGNIYIAGYDSIDIHEFAIQKFDSAGSLIHTTFEDIPGYRHVNEEFLEIHVDDAANIYLLNDAGNTSFTQRSWLTAKLDSSLALQWLFLYTDSISGYSYTNSMCVIDSGIVISGMIPNYLEHRVVQFQDPTTTLVFNNNRKSLFSIWPNPSTGKSQINFESDQSEMQLRIYDLNSKLIDEIRIEPGTSNLDLSGLSAGCYMLALQSKNGIQYSKLILQ